MKDQRRNPLEAIDAVPADITIEIKLRELDAYFACFDRTSLGKNHHTYFDDGSEEAHCLSEHFPQMCVAVVYRSLRLLHAKPDSLLSSNYERWLQEIYETETKRTRFDFARSREIRDGSGTFVIYLPKASHYQNARFTNAN